MSIIPERLDYMPDPVRVPLADRYIIPPFSVIDTKSGAWQDRKRAWRALGLDGGAGRDDTLLSDSDLFTGRGGTFADKWAGTYSDGTSVFDPALCEVAYSWFCPPDGVILDPYSGGSTRGVVAATLNREYIGVDLSADQVSANIRQARTLLTPDMPLPRWHVGDSRLGFSKLFGGELADFVFTCPPYHDLERYSDDPRDLSNLSWPDFVEAYTEVIERSVECLNPDRFSAWVVGDIRDKRTGAYRDLPGLTKRIHEAAGLHLENEIVVLTPCGTAAVRAPNVFEATRRTIRTHQYLLVFVKGDVRGAVAALGSVHNHAIRDQMELFGSGEMGAADSVDSQIGGRGVGAGGGSAA